MYGKDLGNLEYHTIEGDYHYIGRSWDSVGDDETGKQFKESVETKLAEMLGKKVECCTVSEAWHC